MFSKRGAKLYEGVEGFPEPVTAWKVWDMWVRSHGLARPARWTIHLRLEAGYRTQDELLHHRRPCKPFVRVLKVKPRCQDGFALRAVPAPAAERPTLPDLEREYHWDKHYYRRGE